MSASCQTEDIDKTKYVEEYNYINRSDYEITIVSYFRGEPAEFSVAEGDTLTITGFTDTAIDDVIADDDSASVTINEDVVTFYALDTLNLCNILYLENYQYERRGEDHVFYYTFTENICEEGD